MSDGWASMHLELPALRAGVALVHLEEVAGEEVGLLAALGAADLDDDVAVVVGVLGQQQELELLVEAGDVGLGRVDLGAQHLAVVAVGVGEHLPGRREVVGALAELLEAADEVAELAVAAASSV